MNLHRYRFTNTWHLRGNCDAVFAALLDLDEYPRWWWGFRTARRIDEETVQFVMKSVLPYRLDVREKVAVLEPKARHATVELAGDLAGRFDFVVTDEGAGRTRVDFILECTAERTLLRVLAPVARFAYRQNHEMMMRRGLVGLERHLAVASR